MSLALKAPCLNDPAIEVLQTDDDTPPGATLGGDKIINFALFASDDNEAHIKRGSAPHLLRLEGEGHGDLVRIDDVTFVLGRDQGPALPINHRGVSRRHARIFSTHGNWYLEDLGSKNGTLLNHVLIGPPVQLRNDDLVNLGNGAVFRYIDDPMADGIYRDRMVMIGPRDPVTSTMMPNEFDNRARAEFAFHSKYDLPLAYAVIDVDKSGRPEDALALTKELSRRLRASSSRQDLLCHLSQSRFAVLYRQTTRHEALKHAERIRADVKAQPFRLGSNQWQVTISAGVAAIPGHQYSFEGLKAFADFALDQARQDGGNRVETAQ